MVDNSGFGVIVPKVVKACFISTGEIYDYLCSGFNE